MTEIWGLAALWIGLALLATLLSIRLRVATALSEIVVGTIAQLIIGALIGTAALGAPHGRNTDAYVLARGASSTMSGSLEDLERLQSRYKTPFLWFRRDGHAYVIQDPKVIDQANALFEPVRRLAPRQEDIASREQVLDREEESLDTEQDAIDSEQDEFEEEDAPPVDSARREALRQQQKALSARQSDLGRRQRDLAREEKALDEEEEKLDAAAEVSLWKLMDASVRDGVAAPAESR